jgi:hypothetical protein
MYIGLHKLYRETYMAKTFSILDIKHEFVCVITEYFETWAPFCFQMGRVGEFIVLEGP